MLLTMAEKTSDMCPDGCTYTGEVKAAKVVTVHSKAEQYEGWTHMAGACRGPTPDGEDAPSKVNARYSKTYVDGGPGTQRECKDSCAEDANCIGYAHADSSWCVIYGPGMNITDSAWTADYHPATTITQTKPNAAYICGVLTPVVVTDDVVTKSESEAACRHGAMLALALWLTRFWQ